MMPRLLIRVTDDFSLDAGHYTLEVHSNRTDYRIFPPATPLFDQLVTYLETLPPTPHIGYQNRFLAVGLTALTVRWGSYLAALCDSAFPLYAPDVANIPAAQNRDISLIADEEMCRMNIEISANIAQMGRMYREQEARYFDLLRRACHYLPMRVSEARSSEHMREFLSKAHTIGSMTAHMGEHPEDFKRIVQDFNLPIDDEPSKALRIERTASDPDRVIANFLALWTWRNSTIEDIHAGLHLSIDAPLLPGQRRLTDKLERQLLRDISSRAYELNYFMPRLFDPTFRVTDPRYFFIRAFPESATALVNAGFAAYYPFDWSTTDSSSEVTLSHRQRVTDEAE